MLRQTSPKTRLRGIVAAPILAAALILAACAGDGGSEPAPAAPSPAPEPEAPEAFPTRPISLIVPFGVGGGGDSTTRPIASSAAAYTDVPVRVINMPGAGATIGTQFVADADPDGYTLLMHTATIIISTFSGEVNYTVDDFIPVSVLTGQGVTFVVRCDSPYGTLEELVAGDIVFGHSGAGSSAHSISMAFADAAGANWTDVPFDGTGPAILALRGGSVDMVPAIGLGGWADAVETGELCILAITSGERSSSLPDVPTVAELGLADDFAMFTWRGFFVPAGTPTDRVEYLNSLFAQVHEDEGFRSQISRIEEVFPFIGKDDFASFLEGEEAIYRGLFDRGLLN